MDKGKTMVLGLGVSGLAAADLLSKFGTRIRVYDDTVKSSKYEFSDSLDDIDIVVVSPGIPYDHKILKESRERRIHIMSELELGASFIENDKIAITGTNGKTTTTLLVTEILKEAGFNAIAMGNIGDPVCKYALKMNKNDIAVIEVSSFQLETTNYFQPKVAAIINIAPDHLDRHKGYEDYISTKLRIFSDLTTMQKAVVNYDYKILREFAPSIKAPVTYFSSEFKVRGCYVQNDNIYYNGYVCGVEDLAMKEPFTLENILCALSICLPYGVSASTARKVLMRFTPPEYRMSNRGMLGGKKYINDSKGTNIHSTLAACKAVSGETALILGGSDKGEDFKELFSNLPEYIKYVLVTGENAPKIMASADKCGYEQISVYGTLSEVMDKARTLDVSVVLFSPASASFDRYTNYIERGKVFDSLLC